MSLLTTPERSIARSALSTPSTAEHGTPPQQLTPRSKVKAMLEAIDDDSDPEPIEESKGFPRKVLSATTGNAQKVEIHKDVGSDENPVVDEDSIDDCAVKPRGKLASRLIGRVHDEEGSTQSNKVEGDGNAYARIKKQLLRTKVKRARGPFSDSESDNVESKELLSHQDASRFSMTPRRASQPRFNRHNSSESPRSSPGIFITPESTGRRRESTEKEVSSDRSECDETAEPQVKSRFLELVAKTRAKEEAKQAEKDRKLEEKSARQRSFQDQLSQDALSGSGFSDEERAADRRLTQQSRPTRKASKKALEEMNRETQRMSRNMQLAHQAKTKKKITKDSLFARFNFRIPTDPNGAATPHMSSSTAASSAPVTDIEDALRRESPPTSPMEAEDLPNAAVEPIGLKGVAPNIVAAMPNISEEDELPSMLEMMTQPGPTLDKGKGKAIEQINLHQASQSSKSKKYVFTQRPIKVRPAKRSLQSSEFDVGSESDLEVMPSRKKKGSRIDVFDRLPPGKIQEARSLRTLRALAHLNSPEKRSHDKRSSMSLADLQKSLQGRARQQAVEERAAKIEDLKSKGIIVQSAEERQKDQAEVEDLLEKARKEGEEIHQKEKRAAKKAKIANGEADDLSNSSDEDDDYEEDEPDIELSGSEEEHVEDPDTDNENASVDRELDGEDEEDGGVTLDDTEPKTKGLLDDEASEDGDDEEEEEEEEGNGPTDQDASDDGDQVDDSRISRSRRNKMVVSDDDDDEEGLNTGIDAKAQGHTPPAQLPVIPPIFVDPNHMVVPMGMTQAFAATMADTQTQAYEIDEEQDSLALLGPLPEPDIPMFDIDDMVEDSQNGAQLPDTNKEIDLHFSQSQIRHHPLGDTQGDIQDAMATQLSEIPDPTQDVGFVKSSPAPQRFASPPLSTVDTVLLSGRAGGESPIRRKRGRLQRRAVVEEDWSDGERSPATLEQDGTHKIVPVNAFDAMEKARKKAAVMVAKEAFSKKKSEAKGMVEEQAQESEDEFQGIGGPSDDESGVEDDEYVREMIDQGEVEVNERQLAALHADRERASDEKAVEKLYKDINSGMLRRKRGAEFDLSDSDDDAEARQRRKRREFAKMRKALLENENVGKIAEDPKKLAFLRAIEDREYDEDLDFLDRPAEDSFRVETGTEEEPESQSQRLPVPSEAANDAKRRQPLEESLPGKTNMRPPAAARRTAPAKKPATLAEIRESVSFLIEEPGSFTTVPEPSSSASEDDSTPNQSHRNPRRTGPKNIVDRLSLKRAESATTSSTTRFAFHNPSATNSDFKVPSLLRRATTTQLHANAADKNGISTAAATERAAG
ncbi:mediator of replication checkpoint protein 1, partial [Lecanoromycetidae sp. Uapishka_2]